MKPSILFFRKLVFVCLAAYALLACNSTNKPTVDSGTADSELILPQQPNILWLVTEDMGHYIPTFGDSTITTPNLSRLADEGVAYSNLYSVSGVCAPSRSAIATGMYPTSIGTSHMRTTSYTEVTGLQKYEGVPAPEVKMVSELLRHQGYYCTNNYKTDYQFKHPATAWDETSPYAHWRNRAEGQPFFAVFNFTETHESGLFEPYGFRHSETRHYHAGDRSYKWGAGRMTKEETTVHLSPDTDFEIPPYLPDNDITRRDMWKLYNNVAEMDKQAGAILAQLEADGLLENTIIFFYGDHGGPLPREKRLVYDSGLRTPLIVRFPQKQKAGSQDDQLISFVDFAPTLLSLAGVAIPEHIQGQAFLGKGKSAEKRHYIHGAADRFDGFTDAIRAVRDERFKYIRNYRPHQGYYLPVAYREQIPCMQELLRMRDAGTLTPEQAQWFRESKPADELFDCLNDPYELNNLAQNPEYKEKLKELSDEMDRWIAEIGDQPNLPEGELIKQLWHGATEQPTTAQPEIKNSNRKISMTCSTNGASIGYKIIKKGEDAPRSWTVYQHPFTLEEGDKVQMQAHRIGYQASEIIKYDNK